MNMQKLFDNHEKSSENTLNEIEIIFEDVRVDLGYEGRS